MTPEPPAEGGPGRGETYTVRYRRKDGTEAEGQGEYNDRGGWSWLAPEDCAAILEVITTGGGGRGTGRVVGEYGAQGPRCGT